MAERLFENARVPGSAALRSSRRMTGSGACFGKKILAAVDQRFGGKLRVIGKRLERQFEPAVAVDRHDRPVRTELEEFPQPHFACHRAGDRTVATPSSSGNESTTRSSQRAIRRRKLPGASRIPARRTPRWFFLRPESRQESEMRVHHRQLPKRSPWIAAAAMDARRNAGGIAEATAPRESGAAIASASKRSSDFSSSGQPDGVRGFPMRARRRWRPFFAPRRWKFRRNHRHVDRRGRRAFEKSLQVVAERDDHRSLPLVRFRFGRKCLQFPRRGVRPLPRDKKRAVDEPAAHRRERRAVHRPSPVNVSTRRNAAAADASNTPNRRRKEPFTISIWRIRASTGASGALKRRPGGHASPSRRSLPSRCAGDTSCIAAVSHDVSVGSGAPASGAARRIRGKAFPAGRSSAISSHICRSCSRSSAE